MSGWEEKKMVGQGRPERKNERERSISRLHKKDVNPANLLRDCHNRTHFIEPPMTHKFSQTQN